MCGAFLPTRTDLHPSCYRCWKLGVAFASAPPNSDANWCGTHARVGLAASSCRFLVSVRSPQPPLPQLLRSLTTSNGHISRRGDRPLRGLLYEAAAVILTRSSTHSTLRTWGLQLRERIGFKRAAVAVARKLAVIMHTMLKTGELFNPNAEAAA